ncbi:MAG TPA: FAD-dependent oxidoreductase [Geminicoccaceae bacterium]|nr:FAD-dependent oxidoreductase [Geminicoccaceae bacterium]
MQSCDVLIVGAGIAGASAAYEIAQSAEVILLERESQPGYHTTGRSAAVYAPGYGNRVIRILTAASSPFYHDRAGGLAEHPVLTPRGALFVARQDQLATLDALFTEIRAQVPALERLDASKVLARVPVLRADYVAGGLYDPTSMDMDVAAIHQGYLKGFRARGGTLITDAEVTAIAADGASWRVETRAGSFAAKVLVDAAGAWADELATMAGVAPVGLTPKRRTAILFEASVQPDPAWPIVLDADEEFYFKPESGLLLGSPADETPVPPSDVQPEELDVAIAIDRIERAADFQVRLVRRKWAGLRTFASDRTPVVGMDETRPGFFWLAGQGGYGIQMAPALARAAARLLLEGTLPDDLSDQGLRAEDLMPARLRHAS